MDIRPKTFLGLEPIRNASTKLNFIGSIVMSAVRPCVCFRI